MQTIKLSPEVIVTLQGTSYVSSTAEPTETVSALIRAAEVHEARARQLRQVLGQVVRAKK